MCAARRTESRAVAERLDAIGASFWGWRDQRLPDGPVILAACPPQNGAAARLQIGNRDRCTTLT
jgi:hypothetical protein